MGHLRMKRLRSGVSANYPDLRLMTVGLRRHSAQDCCPPFGERRAESYLQCWVYYLELNEKKRAEGKTCHAVHVTLKEHYFLFFFSF